ncbi:MAG: hypothetical protein ACK52S_14010, partial [Pirellula sp.]
MMRRSRGGCQLFHPIVPKSSSVLPTGYQGLFMLSNHHFSDASHSVSSSRFLRSAMDAFGWFIGFSAVFHFADAIATSGEAWEDDVQIIGLSVTPHQFSPNMQWRRAPNPELSARVEMFV